ncbi:caspase family protein [Bacteroidota bacterium]
MKKLFILVFLLLPINILFAQKVTDEGPTLYLDFTEKPTILEMKWLSPVLNYEKIEEPECQVKVGIKASNDINGVNIKVNGRQISMDRGFEIMDATDDEYNKVLEKRIRLVEGQNIITIDVTDEKGKTISEERTINYEIPKIVRRDFALLFATDEYDEWTNLSNPVFDAETIGNDLRDNYGFQVEIVKNATRSDLLAKIKEYSTKSYLEHDQLLIFFAGHGQFDEAFGAGYVVCKDTEKNDPGKASYVPHSTLRDVINNIRVNHIYLVMDVCFGGTFDPLIAKAGFRGEENFNLMTHQEFIKKKLQYRTRRYLTSGGKQYVPDGTPGAHSPFARSFLEALRNYGGQDKILTSQELLTYMDRLIPEPRTGEFGSNEPGSDFIFVAKED